MTEEDGTANFKDVIDGQTVHEQVDENTGMSALVIIVITTGACESIAGGKAAGLDETRIAVRDDACATSIDGRLERFPGADNWARPSFRGRNDAQTSPSTSDRLTTELLTEKIIGRNCINVPCDIMRAVMAL